MWLPFDPIYSVVTISPELISLGVACSPTHIRLDFHLEPAKQLDG